MFNLQGSELVIILLLALVVLGPEKLPEAMRRMGRFYGELKKMSTGFQQEFRSAVDEPMREFRQTADALKDSVDFTKLQNGERDVKPTSAEMASTAPVPAEIIEPSSDVPFAEAGPVATPVVDDPLEAVTDDMGLREARPRAADRSDGGAS
ncbi:MAG: Sec-independent protein translocase subunit TatA/TatB [Ilumatobacteraceae bacterium]